MRPAILILYDILEDDASSFVLQPRPDSLNISAIGDIRRDTRDSEGALELLKDQYRLESDCRSDVPW